MTTAAIAQGDHPVAAGVARLRAELTGLAKVPVWSMTQGECARTLLEVTRLAAQVAALELRLAGHAHAVRVEELAGATSTASWWSHHTHATRAETHRKVRLAVALDAHRGVAAELSTGRIVADQAAVIVDAVDALPDGVDPEVVRQAEAHLLELAGDFDAKALRRLGKAVLGVVAPEVGEAHEAEVLAREERAAEASARFSMVEDGHGRVHGRFTVSTLQGAMLRKALLAIAAPRHRAAVEGKAPPPMRPSAERLGQAFAEYVERYPAEQLPQAGGVAATVVVTLGLGDLVARLDTGEAISAGAARRLACEAGILPAVLGGESQVLDLGRRRRFHTKAQRVALGLRDGGCTAEGCDWPPGLCHAHHDRAWQRGGPTDVRHARLLCPRHHARAHDPAYDRAELPGGRVAFHRRI